MLEIRGQKWEKNKKRKTDGQRDRKRSTEKDRGKETEEKGRTKVGGNSLFSSLILHVWVSAVRALV